MPLGRPLKIRGKDLFAPLGVLITASGLQGEQPLVDRLSLTHTRDTHKTHTRGTHKRHTHTFAFFAFCMPFYLLVALLLVDLAHAILLFACPLIACCMRDNISLLVPADLRIVPGSFVSYAELSSAQPSGLSLRRIVPVRIVLLLRSYRSCCCGSFLLLRIVPAAADRSLLCSSFLLLIVTASFLLLRF